jgi:hypothetical protein
MIITTNLMAAGLISSGIPFRSQLLKFQENPYKLKRRSRL